MKKILMTVAILTVGAVAYANVSAPVNVSLDVITTSNLVLMDGATQLTQIDLAHPQILLSAAGTTTTSSVVSKTFTAQTGDGSDIMVTGNNKATVDYALNGTGTAGLLPLTNGTQTLDSTLALARTSDDIVGAGIAAATANAITSTIAPNALNGLTATGTYAGNATLNVTVTQVQ